MDKILFIQPWDRPWFSKTKVKNRKSIIVSRTQFEIGYSIPEEFDFNVLDLNLVLKQGFSIQTAIQKIDNETKLILISWPNYVAGDQVKLIVNLIRENFSNVKIVIGGQTLSLLKEESISHFENVDSFYFGSIDDIAQLVSNILTGKKIESIPGVCLSKQKNINPIVSSKIIDGYNPEEFYTSKNRRNFNDYISSIKKTKSKIIGLIEMSRGCKFNCGYCAINSERIGFNTRNPKTVIAESKFLAEKGVFNQVIIDPTLGLNKKETKELLSGLSKINKDFPLLNFEVLSRPELINEEFVKNLKNANVTRCCIGMETMDEASLFGVNKTLIPNITRNAVSWLSKYEIETKLFHILFPDKFSFNTVKFFSELKEENKKFIIQTSFLRNLERQKTGIEYLKQDQTIFVPEFDSRSQLMEWMLSNLGYDSMDLGRSTNDQIHKEIINAKSEKKLRDLFYFENEDLCLKVSGKIYYYKHYGRKLKSVSDCLYED